MVRRARDRDSKQDTGTKRLFSTSARRRDVYEQVSSESLTLYRSASEDFEHSKLLKHGIQLYA